MKNEDCTEIIVGGGKKFLPFHMETCLKLISVLKVEYVCLCVKETRQDADNIHVVTRPFRTHKTLHIVNFDFLLRMVEHTRK